MTSTRPFVRRCIAAVVSVAFIATGGNAHPSSVQETVETAPATQAAKPAASIAEGIWQGQFAAGPGMLFARAVVRSAADGTPEVILTVPAAMAIGVPAKDVRLVDRELGFTLVSRGAEGRFSGTIAEDGRTYSGTFTLSTAGQQQAEAPFTLSKSVDAGSVPGHTTWKATLAVMGQSLPMTMVLAESDAFGWVGALDIAMQGLDDFPLLVTKTDAGFTVVLPVGVDAVMTLAPAKDADGRDTLAGTFKQGQIEAPITFTKQAGAEATASDRPQHPAPPFPYAAKDVEIRHRFGHTLAGTLTLPPVPDGTKVPAVVLVSGSGPQDRDETLFGHKPFLVIADALTRAGIAVLRYDDRGVGRSTGIFDGATSFDFATDADEAVEWLKKQPGIDATRIGIVGHSEGGLIAPMVARWQWEEGDATTAVRFLVLLAGPAVSGRDVLVLQLRRILEAEKLAAADIDAMVAAQTAALDAIVANLPKEEIVARLRALVELQAGLAAKQGIQQSQDQLDAAINAAYEELTGPWMKTFLAYDPRETFASLVIPVLAMNGTLDVQVDHVQNLDGLSALAKEHGVRLDAKRYEGLNHLFQPAITGSTQEYGTITTTFDPKALADLVAWVTTIVKDPSLDALKPKVRPEGATRTDDALVLPERGTDPTQTGGGAKQDAGGR